MSHTLTSSETTASLYDRETGTCGAFSARHKNTERVTLNYVWLVVDFPLVAELYFHFHPAKYETSSSTLFHLQSSALQQAESLQMRKQLSRRPGF